MVPEASPVKLLNGASVMVSLVSQQTIPNVLAILHFKPERLLFVSTEKMQQNHTVEAILKALEIKGLPFSSEQYDIIKVEENSVKDCMDKLKNWTKGLSLNRSKIIVNLTGGTKMMSIGAYEAFKGLPCQMIYIPFPQNEFVIPYPPHNVRPPIPIEVRLRVVEYLTAYGISITAKGITNITEQDIKRIEQRGKLARDRFAKTKFIYDHYPRLKPFLKQIWSELKTLEQKGPNEFQNALKQEQGLAFSFTYSHFLNEDLHTLFRHWGFKAHGQKVHCRLNTDTYQYFIGGWLEEYVYNTLFELTKEGLTDVQLNLQLFRKGVQNEFDVMFTYENALYFVECKSLDQRHDKNQDILYKVGALQSDFGLRVKSFLATQSPSIFDKKGEIKDSLKKRARHMHTEILPLTQIGNLKRVLREKILQN